MDKINYIEQYVNGQQVEKVKKGDNVEVRVVYTIDLFGGLYYFIEIQRIPGGESVRLGPYPRQGGNYYVAYTWPVTYEAGSYMLEARILGESLNVVDSKSFPHIVEAPTKPPNGNGQNGENGGEQNGEQPPYVIYAALGLGVSAAVILGVVLGRRVKKHKS